MSKQEERIRGVPLPLKLAFWPVFFVSSAALTHVADQYFDKVGLATWVFSHLGLGQATIDGLTRFLSSQSAALLVGLLVGAYAGVLAGTRLAGIWRAMPSKAERLTDLGYSMLSVASQLEYGVEHGNAATPRQRLLARSCELTLKKELKVDLIGLDHELQWGWMDCTRIYFESVGTLLSEGHFKEAAQLAESTKAGLIASQQGREQRIAPIAAALNGPNGWMMR